MTSLILLDQNQETSLGKQKGVTAGTNAIPKNISQSEFFERLDFLLLFDQCKK
jgi:hypothetical protein